MTSHSWRIAARNSVAPDQEQIKRWRLVLGKPAQESLPELIQGVLKKRDLKALAASVATRKKE